MKTLEDIILGLILLMVVTVVFIILLMLILNFPLLSSLTTMLALFYWFRVK